MFKSQNVDKNKEVGLENIIMRSSIKVYNSYKTIIYI